MVQARETIFSLSDEFRIDLVRITPSPLTPGESADLVLEVQNLKDQAITNSYFELTPEYPISILTPRISFPVIDPRETKELHFKIAADSAAQAGSFKTTLVYNVASLDLSASAPINVTVTKSKTLITTQVQTEPERVAPGSSMKIRLTLKNTADSTLKDISVRIDFLNGSVPLAPLDSSSERIIKHLGVGEEAEVEFNSIASPNAKLDVYRVPIAIRFHDELGKQFISNDIIGIAVDTPPQYQLNLEQREVFTKGDKGKVSVTLSNTGVSEMKFITLSILEGDGYSVLSKNTAYIGNLESDDFETADFDVFVDQEDGVVPLTFLIQYKDVYSKEYGAKLTIPLKLYTEEQAKTFGLKQNSNGSYFAIGAIVLIIFGVIIYRKKKKMSIL